MTRKSLGSGRKRTRPTVGGDGGNKKIVRAPAKRFELKHIDPYSNITSTVHIREDSKGHYTIETTTHEPVE